MNGILTYDFYCRCGRAKVVLYLFRVDGEKVKEAEIYCPLCKSLMTWTSPHRGTVPTGAYEPIKKGEITIGACKKKEKGG